MTLATTAAPIMDQVVQATRERSVLGVLDGFEVVYLHVVEADRAVRVHTTMALLAQLPPERVKTLLPDTLRPYTPHTITDRQKLLRELERVRVRGYATDLGGWREDAGGVAAPIRGRDRGVVGALCVAAPRNRLTPGRMQELARATVLAASDISRALGFVDGDRRGPRAIGERMP